MLITLFYWLLAPFYRRSERTTIGEIIEDRYGSKMGLIYSVFAIIFFVFVMGVLLQSDPKVISVASGSQISPNMVVLVMTIAFLIYSFEGGLIAAAYTDFIQSFPIITLSVMLIPLVLKQINRLAGMRAVLPDNFFDLFNSASGEDFFTIAILAGFFSFWVERILTKPESKVKNEAFFDNMRRKSDTKMLNLEGKKPLASETGKDALLSLLTGMATKRTLGEIF